MMAKGPSSLEAAFLRTWKMIAGDAWPYPKREFRFHPVRKWRFDFAWERERVAVEMEGGVFIGGGHNRGRQYTMDCRKYNSATAAGWRVLRYTTADITERPVQMIEEITSLLAEGRKAETEEQGDLFKPATAGTLRSIKNDRA